MRQRKASFLPKGTPQVERIRRMAKQISSKDIIWEDDLKVTIHDKPPEMMSLPKLMATIFDRGEMLLRYLLISWGCWLVTIIAIIYLLVTK